MSPAPDELDVAVLPSDIEHGRRGSETHCALAIALMRTFAEQGASCCHVSIQNFGRAVVWTADGMRIYDHDADSWIESFDADDEVQPTTVHLRRQVRHGTVAVPQT